MVDMTTKEKKEALAEIGFHKMVGEINGELTEQFHNTIRAFQTGYAFENLLIDGVAGRHTRAALKYCVNHRGLASPHFKFREFASKGNGHIWIKRQLIRRLEKLRAISGPISILSGYRDPYHNDVTVKAVPNSQHKYGNAVDPIFQEVVTLNEVKRLYVFSGIGYKYINSKPVVRHVDVRHLGPNTTRSSVKNPATWRYA